MTFADDIKDLPSGAFTEKPPQDADDKASSHPPFARSVGPESEVRGGPEAPSDSEELGAPV
jgi:hypothetical protein